MKKQFTMSMYASEKHLLKAKCEYLESENEKLMNVATEAREVYFNFGLDNRFYRQLFLSLVAAKVLDPQLV